jgi:hypothetical protein
LTVTNGNYQLPLFSSHQGKLLALKRAPSEMSSWKNFRSHQGGSAKECSTLWQNMSESEKAAYAPARKTLTSSIHNSLSTRPSSTKKPSTKKASTKKPSTKKSSTKKASTQKKDEEEGRQVVILFPDGSHSSVITLPTGVEKKACEKWIPALLSVFELFPRKYKGV